MRGLLHARRSLRVVAWLAALVVWTQSWPARGLAQAAPLRAIVRTSAGIERALLERIRGQVSDLPVDLVAAETGDLEPTFALQLNRADTLARELGGSVVVWFNVAEGGHVLVCVATPATGRVLVRRMEPGADAADGAPIGSGQLEAAALVVRFALSALAKGGSIGVAEETAIAAETAEPEPEAAVELPLPGDGVSEPQASERAWWWALGYQATADGFSSAGSHGLSARGTLQWRGLVAALHASSALPVTRSDALAEVEIARHAFGTALGAHTALASELWLTGAATFSVLVITRSSRPLSAGVRAERARASFAPAFGPDLRLSFRRGRFGLALGLGLDIVPRPTRFAYRGGATALQAQLATLEPHATLAAEVSLP